MIFKQIPVTVCHNSGLAEFIIKNQSDSRSSIEKLPSPEIYHFHSKVHEK